MPRLSILLPLLLVAAPCGFAQQAPDNGRAGMRDSACPVWLHAQRDAEGMMMATQDGQKDSQGRPVDQSAQGLKVRLSHAPSSIEAVAGTLYATRSFGASAMPIQSGLPAPDASKTVEVHRAAGQTSLANFEVWMGKVGALRWVELTSITYADGTTWKAAKDSVCRAFPSLFVPVDASAR